MEVEKRKSSNEGRLHSCALLRRPTTLSWGKNVRLGEMGSKYHCVVKIGFQKITCNLKLLVRWDLTTTTITSQQHGSGGGSEKRKSSNEGRSHSCALLRRPTTLSWGKNVRLGEMGSKYHCVVKIGFQKITCNLKLLVGGILHTSQQNGRQQGWRKRKSSNEGRLHSCALLRRPTTLSWGKRC